MPATIHKLIVTNRSALRAKYGAAGEKKIRLALNKLADADRARGLLSKQLLLDSAASMKPLRLTALTAAGDWESALRAMDAAWQKYQPSYLVIVGSDDIVPQARVSNPFGAFSEDPDPHVPSDLPYACDLPDDWRLPASGLLNPSDLIGATRVVGRLPDIVGASSPDFLLSLIDACVNWTSRAAVDYRPTFALSAAAWQGSSRSSLDALGGPGQPLHLSPTKRAPWTKSAVAARTHFVNCHGGDTTADWFGQGRPVNGQPAPVDIVALRPEDVDGRVLPGTIVAAECCYGAMHAAPAALGERLPMMWAYLKSGAYACVGSSTTAYGPADGMGQADLLTRFALAAIKAGSSTGRALLEARQRFIREAANLDPGDLKTLMQFDLLGDPSIHPVATARPKVLAKGSTGKAAAAPITAGITSRRQVLRATGRALDASVTRAAPRPERRAGISASQLARAGGIPASRLSGPVRSFGESPRGPRRGLRYHAAPVQAEGLHGFIVAREQDNEITATTVWARSPAGATMKAWSAARKTRRP